MKPTHVLLFSFLLLIGTCSKNQSDSKITNKTAVSENGASEKQLDNETISTEIDSSTLNNLLSFLMQNVTSDSSIEFIFNSDEFKLFGMNIVTDTILPSDTAGETRDNFYHYNPKVLKKIDAALDNPLVQKALGSIHNIKLSVNWKPMQYYSAMFESESTFVNSLLLHRLYLVRYPEVKKKIKSRYELAICRDSSSEYLNTTFDLSSTFNGEYMAFWIRRSFDGTDALFESILRKTIRIMNPGVYAAIDSIETAMNTNYRAGEQVVLAFDSYSDEYAMDPVVSIFPGRDNIFCQNAFLLDSISDFERNQDVDYRMSGADVEKMLREKSRCSLFDGTYTFYALYVKDGITGWWQITPEYALAFKSYRESCDGPDVYWTQHLTIGIHNDTTVPLLISAIASGSKKRPGKEVIIPEGIVEDSDIPESDTTSYTITTTYKLPKNTQSLVKLRKLDDYAFVGGEIRKRVLVKSTLMAKWSDGSERPIYADEGEGYYEYTDAHIVDIILTDIDGDGQLDISFTVKGNGKWVGLYRNGHLYELKIIKNAKPDVSGGC
jgi:hypothetical protein